MIRRLAAVALIGTGSALLALLSLAHVRASPGAPEPTVLLEDHRGAYLGEVNIGADERMGFWPTGARRCNTGAVLPECLPERVVAATLAVEDHRFDDHPGVDPTSVARAVVQNYQAGHTVSGASTIAMQVARLQTPGRRPYSRKIVEAVTALVITERWGRDAVLARYLQLAPYGNNVYGIRYASRRYFGKPVNDLSWAETALLSGMPRAPGTMNPYTAAGLRRATSRAQHILALLRERGEIEETDYARALEELGDLHFPQRPIRPTSTLHAVLAMDGVEAIDPVVRTTLDLDLQGDVQWALHHAISRWSSSGAQQAATVVVDRRTLAVRASVGSVEWNTDRAAGAMDFANTPRYPGSTLKPFLYAIALDRGMVGPNTLLDDLQRGPEGIGNADHRFLGPLLPRQALANSRNVPAVHLVGAVGVDDVYDIWGDLGLQDGTVPASHYGVGLAIGGMPLTLTELVTAYGALANDGVLRPLRTLERQPLADGRRIFGADHSRLVSAWLADPMARMPSFPRAGYTEYPFSASVKTGTSEDYRDSWAVGYTEDWIVGVWIGHPDWRPMKGISGYRGSARVLNEILLHLHKSDAHGLSDRRPLGPEDWVSQAICPLSGNLATPRCDGVLTEWFPADAALHDCTAHVRVGGRVVVDLDPRYAAWMASAGLPAAPRVTVGDADVALEVLSPRQGMRVIRDPEVPENQTTLRLAAAVEPPVEQVVWFVDGEPFAVVGHPYVARWPVEPGAHRFEVRLPYRTTRSASVHIEAL